MKSQTAALVVIVVNFSRSQLFFYYHPGDFENHPGLGVWALQSVNLIPSEVLWAIGFPHHKKGILDGAEGNGTHVLGFLQVQHGPFNDDGVPHLNMRAPAILRLSNDSELGHSSFLSGLATIQPFSWRLS